MASGGVLKHLGQWFRAIVDDPFTCTPQLVADLKSLPFCLKNPDHGCLASLGVVSLLSLAVILVFYFTYRCCCRRKRSVVHSPLPSVPPTLRKLQLKEKKEIDKKKKELVKKEENQKRVAGTVADDLLDIYSVSGLPYNRDQQLPDMGSRVDKYWYRVTSQESYNCHILTIGNISTNFTCDLEVEGYLNQKLSQLQHPYIQVINEVRFFTKEGRKQVGIIQPCWDRGSLKDLIYKASPFQEWSQKYNKITDNLPAKKVALFGGQILEAIVYLYGRGLSPLGHIQSGNIYMEGEDTCKLGGYENALLKYRARLYLTCKEYKCLDDIDVIMFGHVMYEMSAGRELSRLVPNEQDYTYVDDAGCREVLRYIFTRKDDNRFKRGIIKIQTHWFFGGTESEVAEIEPSQQLRKPKTDFLKKTKKLLKQH